MNGNFNVLYIYIYICKIIQYSSLCHRIKNFNSFTQVKFRFPLTYVCNCLWYLWFTLISESNQVDICPLWCCFWFFVVCLFSCRCLVDPLRAKTLLLMIHQLQWLKGLDSHLSHPKTPIWRGLEPRLPHTSTQTSLTGHLL